MTSLSLSVCQDSSVLVCLCKVKLIVNIYMNRSVCASLIKSMFADDNTDSLVKSLHAEYFLCYCCRLPTFSKINFQKHISETLIIVSRG